MLAKNYSDVRKNMKLLCDTIVDNGETVIVTRKDDRNIVMMSLDEYNNLMENMHVRKSTNNYNRILESRSQLEHSKLIEKTNEDLGI